MKILVFSSSFVTGLTLLRVWCGVLCCVVVCKNRLFVLFFIQAAAQHSRGIVHGV